MFISPPYTFAIFLNNFSEAACPDSVFMAIELIPLNLPTTRPQNLWSTMLANITTAKPSSYLRNPHHGSSLGFWLSQLSML
jgi:hypothetical protein